LKLRNWCSFREKFSVQISVSRPNNVRNHKERFAWREMSVARELTSFITFEALSRRGLHPIKLACNPYWPDGRIILTASAFNQVKPVRQQSWSQGTLLRRNRRFFPTVPKLFPVLIAPIPTDRGTARLTGPGWFAKYWSGRTAKCGHQSQY